MAIYSGISHWKWWFSIAMLVYQRVDALWVQLALWRSNRCGDKALAPWRVSQLATSRFGLGSPRLPERSEEIQRDPKSGWIWIVDLLSYKPYQWQPHKFNQVWQELLVPRFILLSRQMQLYFLSSTDYAYAICSFSSSKLKACSICLM